MTFDDSLSRSFIDASGMMDIFFDNTKLVSDAVGCPIKPTFYVMSEGTDYDMVYLLNEFGEIALHTVTHTTHIQATEAHFKSEITNNL